jgi:amino acid adenylation domain-containing protein
MPFTDLTHMLRSRAEDTPNKTAYVFLADGEDDERHLSYRELDARARAIAGSLQQHIEPGDRVLLLCPPGLEFLEGFFGCLYAGAIAVPAFPPDPSALQRVLGRIEAIAQDCKPAAILTTPEFAAARDLLAVYAPALGRLPLLDTDSDGGEEFQPIPVLADDIAFLQYTSGSTGSPKGVVLTHANLLHNEAMINAAMPQGPDAVLVSWLPLFHDMGLIGVALNTVYLGAQCVFMAPHHFLQRPLRWLKAVTKYRATLTGAPNFGFELCMRKISAEERAGLDLSSVQVMFNGAEPIRAETLTRFTEVFGDCGFRAEALAPCYGLAEATLIVSGVAPADRYRSSAFDVPALESGSARPAGPGDGRTLVGVGRAAGRQTILIVDPQTREILPPGAVGEIWVAGPHVGMGYWQRPEASAEVFAAEPASAPPGGPRYLRTGDLGFFHADELYIAGRSKDLLIVRGRNLAPQDLEQAAERVDAGLRPGCGAFFQVDREGAEPLLVAVHEFDGRSGTASDDVIRAVRAAVTEEFDVECDAVVLIQPRTIPKTSSGKIQRRACRSAFEAGELDAVARWESPGAIADDEDLAARVEAGLRASLTAVGLADGGTAIATLGFDSLTAADIRSELQRELGVEVPLVELLRGQDLAAMSRRIAERVRGAAPLPALPKQKELEFPLSDNQLALWYLYEQNPLSAAYNVPVAFRIRQPLDLAVLHRAMSALVERHEALRTRFGQRGGTPYQQVLPSRPLDFRHEDTTTGSDQELRARLADDAEEPFDLLEDPLLRVRVYGSSGARPEDGPVEFVVLLVMHHIITDFWSLAQLADELGRVYAALSAGEEAGLEPLGVRYADFVHWQQRRLGGTEAAHQLDEWAKALTPLPEPLQLPTDHPRPPVRTSNGAAVLHQLDRELAEEAERFAQDHGVTTYTLLLAILQTLLHRYSGQTDLVIGSPVAARERAEFGPVHGLFVNTLPIRQDLTGDPEFAESLWRTQQSVLSALEKQHVPYLRIVERVQPERDAARNPLFQVMYVHQQSHFTDEERRGLAAFALGGEGARANLHALTLESVGLPRRSAQFDLLLMSARGESGIDLSLEFNTDLYDDSTARRILGHFEQLLREAIAAPERRLSQFGLLTPGELRTLQAWNDTTREYPDVRWIHEEFAAQAARTPKAVALVFEGRSLSYRELDEASSSLADQLRGQGAGPGAVVGVALERSFELVVALLGTLKAGAAYLPLDPEYPQERLAHILADAAPQIVLSVARLRHSVPEGTPLLLLDSCTEPSADPHKPREEVVLAADDAAYVIYTSGSTGRPKGVVNTHGAIRNRLAWMQETYRCAPGDRVVQKTPAGFDVSVWEFFWPLMNGATLVLARPGGHRDADYLAELFEREQITIAHFVPTMLQLFLAEPRAAACASLRQVVCSGEALPADLGQRFMQILPGCSLDNLYGPTEAAVDVTFWHCRPDDERDFVPIGRPISNVVIRLLDQHGHLVPVGVPGELCIGGVALARGYHNLPELTAERFIPDPYDADPAARLYRTGDLARYHPDGSIEYLGRIDHQVKIHGNRVELGEIEAILTAHPAVREAVVVLHGSGADAKLVAYIVAEGHRPPAEDLRGHLGERLPGYMLPHQYIVLDFLPQTPNGKIDRKALPAPDTHAPVTTVGVPPRTPEEQTLSRIFGEVLGTGEPGVTDNFFELGGDSIRALQVRARARAAGLDFDLAELLQHPTVERLAKTARTVEATGAGERREPFSLLDEADRKLLSDSVVDAYPLARLQEGLVFHSESSPDYEIYVMGFHLGGTFDEQAMRTALDRLSARHALLRTAFDFTTYSESLQLVHSETRIPLRVHDIRGLPAEEQQTAVDQFMREQKYRKFDWTQPPFLAVDIHLRANQTFQCTLNHPLFDGWSMALLITELMTDYGALARGETPPERPELRLTYADFVALEREAMRSPEHQEFWSRYLADSSRSELPRRPSRRAPAPARHRRTTVTVDRAVADALLKLAEETGTSLKSVVLAAHMRVVSLLTGRTDVTTGIIANGRPEELDGERVPGVFLNTIPLRMQFTGGTWRDLVRQTLAAEREVLPHRRYPLAELVRTQGGGEPLFDTGFNYIHFHIYQALLHVEGLEVLGWSSPSDQTYFPLTAYFHRDISSGELLCFLDLDDAVLEPGQVEEIQGYYRAALAAMAATPDARYERAQLLSGPELSRQQDEWNRTLRPWPADRPRGVHRRFAAVAAGRPDAVAVRAADGSLTYGELERRSDLLAAHLRGLGAGPGATVGIALKRGIGLLVGLLGVLKSGAAYVPMDPAFPQERLRHMLADSGAALVVTDPAVADGLPASDARLVMLADALDDSTAASAFQGPEVGPDDLAYVIYTSGSTGLPKGVEISHGALDNLLTSFEDDFAWTADEVLLAVTTLSFDIAGLELFLPLTTGARLELAAEDESADPQRLMARLAEAGVTTMQATPATWRLLLDGGWHGSPQLRIVCGGEALPADLAESLLPRCRELWNVYGPTETTIWSAAHRLDRADGPPPIGRPLANTRFAVLDPHGEPVPVGTPGELYIGGAGLARGYRNRPDLTVAAFVWRTAVDGTAQRWYRTGDLVRQRPDGVLEYLGRLDSQVKVRGFRIELGEIEAVLGREPSVRQAVALARKGPDGQALLVAYVVPCDADTIDVRALRAALAAELPAYMVPGAFVLMDELPHTPNGKVDRKALPEPAGGRTTVGTDFVAPRNPTEERLVEIWRTLLKTDTVGIDDPFLELGGHSLLMVRMHSQIRREIADLPLVKLFEYPTVRGLAQYIAGSQSSKEELLGVRERAARQRRRRTARAARVGTTSDDGSITDNDTAGGDA